MPRVKKVFNYEFDDGPRQLSSTVNAKCTITGEIIPFYHKFLATLIQNKYKNSYSLFEKTFAKKGAVKAQRIEQGYTDDEFSLNAYSDYLVVCYRGCMRDIVFARDEKTIVSLKNQMTHYADCFLKHFRRNIQAFI